MSLANFLQFVRVHQVLLNILIGKAGLFQTVPFIGAPVAAVLRQIEGVVDVRSCLDPISHLPNMLISLTDGRFFAHRLRSDPCYRSPEPS
jgi:hypothetical protein